MKNTETVATYPMSRPDAALRHAVEIGGFREQVGDHWEVKVTSRARVHKMNDLGAVCGADSWDVAISWTNVTCPACLEQKG